MPRARPLPDLLRMAPFRVSEAEQLGITPRRLRATDLHAPFRGMRSSTPPADLVARCSALDTVMAPGQYFSHTTAARLWGLPLPRGLRTDPRLHVSTAGREPTRRGVIGHRITAIRDIRFHLGLPVVAPSDAWCELAAVRLPTAADDPSRTRRLTLDELIQAGDRLLGWPSPLASAGEIDGALERFGSARGIRSLREARNELRPRSASPRETGLRLLVLRAPAGYPEPELNGPIRLSTGALTHGDLVFRRYRVILEYDGVHHRTDDRQAIRDVDRLNDLARDGWLVVRIHKGTTDAATLDWLDSALRSRGWRP
ncbi:hypothetical protein [Agromyces sp. NPDC057865]|uniref:hypothetical protein n=1 Tax=Agromyces sp. NPDC057865 TaxID=3346267 RepID=UPI00366BFE76